MKLKLIRLHNVFAFLNFIMSIYVIIGKANFIYLEGAMKTIVYEGTDIITHKLSLEKGEYAYEIFDKKRIIV